MTKTMTMKVLAGLVLITTAVIGVTQGEGITRPSMGGQSGVTRPSMGGQSGQPGSGSGFTQRPGMEGHQKPGRDMGNSKMDWMPASDVCTKTKLTSQKLTETEIQKITDVVQGKQILGSVLDFICQIPPACVRQLSMKAVKNESTTLDVSEVNKVICQCGSDKEIIQALIPHVAQNSLCSGVIEPILRKSSEPDMQCDIGTQGKILVARIAVQQGCQNIPTEDKLYWPLQNLKEAMDKMNVTAFKTFLLELANNPDRILTLPCENIETIMDVAQKKFTEANSNEVDVTQLLNLAPFLPASTCKKVTYDMIKTLNKWKEINWYCSNPMRDSDEWSSRSGEMKPSSQGKRHDDRTSWRMEAATLKKCNFECGRILADMISSQLNLSPEQYDDELGTLQKCLDEKKIFDSIRQGKCKDVPEPKNPRHRKLLASKCRPNKKASELTKDDVKNMGCRITDVLTEKDLKQISDTVFCDGSVLREFSANCSSARRLSSVMAKKCANNKLDETLADNLGSAVTDVKCDLLKNADANTKAIIKKHLGSGVDRNNPAKMTCMKDIIDNMVITDKIKSKAIMQTQTCKKTAQESKPMKSQILSSSEDPAYTRAQKSSVMKAFLDGKKLGDLSIDEMKKFRNIVEGANLGSMTNIPEGLKKKAMKVLGMYDDWDGKQIEEMVKNFLSSLKDLNAKNPLYELMPEEVDELSDSFLTGLSSYVKNMTTQTARAVCSRLGKTQELAHFLKRTNRTRLAYSCWDAIGKQSLTEDDIDSLGNLLPELGRELLDKIPADVMKKTGDLFSQIPCMKKNATDYIQQKINQATSSGDDVIPAGIWAARSPANKTKLLENLDAIQQASRRRPGDEYCEKEQMTDKERADRRQAAQEFFDAIRNLANTPDTGSRRKRATTSDTCTVLDTDDYRDKLYLMSASSIRDVSDFADCIAAFGMTEGWNKDQSDALWEQFSKAISGTNVCDLASDQLVDMGTIGYSLAVEDINCLKNLDTDALGALGSKQGWTNEQKNAMINTYMKLNNMNSPASLSADELAAAGHFLCGLSAEDIDKINPATYKEVSKTLGNIIKTCDSEQLQALFKLATSSSAFGDVNNWESALYSDVCIISAGMSPADIRQLSSDDIRYLCNEAVKAMTKEHFEKWTLNQIKSLTVEQSFYLDYSELTSEQLDLLQRDGDTSNDAGVTVFSFLSLVTALIISTAF